MTVQAAERPNILLILPDQMRASAMGCDGNPDVKTPNIDRLAEEGMRFKRTYANVPVCCPARAIMLTGTYPHVNGMIANDLRLREEQATLAEKLQEAGYRTGFVGKWHLDGGPRDPGFVPPGPRRQGFEFWAAYECHHRHFEPTYFRDTPEMITVQKFEPEASCDFAVEFLRSQPKDKPFFLTVQMGPPHDPYGAPEEYMKQYDPAKLTPPVSWQAGSESRPTPKAGLRRGPLANRFVPLGGREEIAAYYAAITAIDDQVGRLLQVLKETGADEDTLILFISDHGDMLGDHGLRRKRKPHDESARVPGIFRWLHKIPQGRVVDTLFSHVDVAPTLLGLAGLDVPPQMQGADLSKVALGQTTEGPEAVLLQIFVPFNPDQVSKPWRGLVTQDYTYARFEDEPWVLFDHAVDPHEMNNLATDPKHTALRGRLDKQLSALMEKNGDSWSFNSSDLVEEGGRLYRFETFYTLDEFRAWAKANPEKAK
ncbi:Arylsulfatase A [Prosthecobacter debontii]|uniref:Arylsulfatase A n=2 Tax=Prosthecobacter debontii TaxID=48467 RepID=A0A1T4YSV7_9BACT|nr:Arylsulfatase A [Prosthecobacter debontii]